MTSGDDGEDGETERQREGESGRGGDEEKGSSTLVCGFFEQEKTENGDHGVPALIAYGSFAPGRIIRNTPSVNIKALKLIIRPNGTSSNFM